MIKRIAALLLSLLLLVAVLPVNASAATEEEVAEVKNNIRRHYWWTLYNSGKSSLSGYCGLLASYQLAYLGINDWAILANGNDQFDTYKDMEYTSEGYRVKPYAAANGYSLEQALNAATRNGTRDVYNILVGFQRTNTWAGRRYGHAVMIYAILDGTVYFTESFGSSLCPYAGYAASCTIEEFAEYYDNWTTFEGIIVFGKKEYLDNCTEYSSHMYVQATKATVLYTQPCSPVSDETESKQLRTVASGERLLVTALYENTLGAYFYQVQESGMTCYVPAEAVKPLRYQFADITIADAVVPQALEQGGSFTVAGEISSVYSDIDAVHIQVTDPQGKVAMGATMQKNSGVYELANDFQPEKGFESLEEGVYTYRLYADGQCSYVQDGKAQTMIQEVTLCSVSFTVGNCDLPWLAEGFAEQPQNGWVLDREKWYYFENGEPRTGWFCQDGVQYYLQEDGAVTTGWAEINGKQRFFTDTGAMRTGWLDTAAGKMYLLSNGVTACGWRTIAGELYYFDENGLMYTGGWLTVGDERYYLQSDGTAAAGWITLDEGNFCFHETDGHLLAQAVGDGAQTVLQAYDAQKGAITDRPTPGIKNAITSA